MPLVFVFGTLKRGFPLHDTGLGGTRCLGAFRTVERFPLMVAGRWFAPMLLYEAGQGERVNGELYQVDDQRLAKLDALESVGHPGNYRFRVAVEGLALPEIHLAHTYFKSRDLALPVHTGSWPTTRIVASLHQISAGGLEWSRSSN